MVTAAGELSKHFLFRQPRVIQEGLMIKAIQLLDSSPPVQMTTIIGLMDKWKFGVELTSVNSCCG
jgi:hypothetical protein